MGSSVPPGGPAPSWSGGGDVLPRRGVEEVLRLGDLASKSVSGGPPVLPGEGNHTHALLGGGCRCLGVRQGCSEGVVGGGDRGGTRHLTPEEGGGGEGSGRWWHPVERTVGVAGEGHGTRAAEQEGAPRAYWTSSATERSTTSGGGGAARTTAWLHS
jgi:hypothetical protein